MSCQQCFVLSSTTNVPRVLLPSTVGKNALCLLTGEESHSTVEEMITYPFIHHCNPLQLSHARWELYFFPINLAKLTRMLPTSGDDNYCVKYFSLFIKQLKKIYSFSTAFLWFNRWPEIGNSIGERVGSHLKVHLTPTHNCSTRQ